MRVLYLAMSPDGQTIVTGMVLLFQFVVLFIISYFINSNASVC
jgi:hypothetical protein